MRKLLILIFCSVIAMMFASCEGCAKKAAKKATNVGISVVEGVTEAINERGEEVTEKATDAVGAMAKGAGKSLDRQLNEHAEYVASVAGRTFVQSIEGFDQGAVEEYYTPIVFISELPEGVALDYFGKIDSKPVIDAFFIILEEGDFNAEFEFIDKTSKVLMTKKAEINKTNKERKYSLVSFALNDQELSALNNSNVTKVIVTKK